MLAPIKKVKNNYVLLLNRKLYSREIIEKTLKDYPKYFTKVKSAKKSDYLMCKVISHSLYDTLEIGNYLLSLSR